MSHVSHWRWRQRIVACVGWGSIAAAAPLVATVDAQQVLAARDSIPFKLPRPTGPRSVGTNAFIVERPAGGDSTRTLKVLAWYPTTDTAGRARAPYLREDAALRAMAALGRNPAAAALGAAGASTHAWMDARIAEAGAPFPVVVFSHGYLGMPGDYTALMEELASHGIAVFSIAHTGESTALTLPDGRTELVMGPGNRLAPRPLAVLQEWGSEDSIATVVTAARDTAQAEAALRWYLARIPHSTASLQRWVDDTRAVVDAIARLPMAHAGRGRRLDLSRLAAVGHSMGGVTSAAYCARDARCRAAINLDGSPQYGDLIDRPSSTPMLMVYSARPGRVGVSDLVYERGSAYTRAVISGTLHLNFGDWQYWQGPARVGAALGTMSAERATTIVHRLVREYLAEQWGGAPSPLLHGAPPYPELELRAARRTGR